MAREYMLSGWQHSNTATARWQNAPHLCRTPKYMTRHIMFSLLSSLSRFMRSRLHHGPSF